MSDDTKPAGAEDNTAVDDKGTDGPGLENVFPDDKVKKARVAAGNKPGQVTDAERVADPTILGVAAGRPVPPNKDERLAADPALEPEAARERDYKLADEVAAKAAAAGVDVHRAVGTESASGKRRK